MHQRIDPGGGEPCGPAYATGVVEHHEAQGGRQGKHGLGKALLPADAGGGAGHQGRMARGHAAGLDQHLWIPAAVNHQFDHQFGELRDAAGRQSPPQHAVVEESQEWRGVLGAHGVGVLIGFIDRVG